MDVLDKHFEPIVERNPYGDLKTVQYYIESNLITLKYQKDVLPYIDKKNTYKLNNAISNDAIKKIVQTIIQVIGEVW
ncbi:hypothetical protein IGI37_000210 [Enterococcus sp. AZ194]|uniref:hypothetical protein n=1 Tax=Enterococcus sp. AZ194 TaxID=2774629 RepID=UPI003F222073